MKEADGFQEAYIKPARVTAVFPRVGIQGRYNCANAPAPIATIDAALEGGMPVILRVGWSPLPNLQSHWVLAYARADDDYWILDPYNHPGDAPGKIAKLLSRYHYRGTTLEQAISDVICLVGTPDAVSTVASVDWPKAKASIPPHSITVFPTEDDLALRADPAITGVLIKRHPKGATLIGLQAKESALAKVGHYNQ